MPTRTRRQSKTMANRRAGSTTLTSGTPATARESGPARHSPERITALRGRHLLGIRDLPTIQFPILIIQTSELQSQSIQLSIRSAHRMRLASQNEQFRLKRLRSIHLI